MSGHSRYHDRRTTAYRPRADGPLEQIYTSHRYPGPREEPRHRHHRTGHTNRRASLDTHPQLTYNQWSNYTDANGTHHQSTDETGRTRHAYVPAQQRPDPRTQGRHFYQERHRALTQPHGGHELQLHGREDHTNGFNRFQGWPGSLLGLNNIQSRHFADYSDSGSDSGADSVSVSDSEGDDNDFEHAQSLARQFFRTAPGNRAQTAHGYSGQRMAPPGMHNDIMRFVGQQLSGIQRSGIQLADHPRLVHGPPQQRTAPPHSPNVYNHFGGQNYPQIQPRNRPPVHQPQIPRGRPPPPMFQAPFGHFPDVPPPFNPPMMSNTYMDLLARAEVSPTRRQTLATTRATLQTRRIRASDQDDDGKTECSICKNDVRVGDEVKELPCRHWFHEECIGLWGEQNASCPICRGAMS